MERASKTDADKVRAGKIGLRKDKVEDAADVARVQDAARVADKARAKVAVEAVGADKIVNAVQTNVLLSVTNKKIGYNK